MNWPKLTRLHEAIMKEWQRPIFVWRPRMAMKKEEARRAVLSEYDKWVKKHPDDASMMGGFLFFRYIQEERSDLLDFRAVGNKWQIVHGWLRDRLKD